MTKEEKKTFKKKVKEACVEVHDSIDASMMPGLNAIKKKEIAGVPFYYWDLIMALACVTTFIAVPYFWLRSILLILAIYGIAGAVMDFKAYNKLKKGERK
jgi:hypothetical protein